MRPATGRRPHPGHGPIRFDGRTGWVPVGLPRLRFVSGGEDVQQAHGCPERRPRHWFSRVCARPPTWPAFAATTQPALRGEQGPGDRHALGQHRPERRPRCASRRGRRPPVGQEYQATVARVLDRRRGGRVDRRDRQAVRKFDKFHVIVRIRNRTARKPVVRTYRPHSGDQRRRHRFAPVLPWKAFRSVSGPVTARRTSSPTTFQSDGAGDPNLAAARFPGDSLWSTRVNRTARLCVLGEEIGRDDPTPANPSREGGHGHLHHPDPGQLGRATTSRARSSRRAAPAVLDATRRRTCGRPSTAASVDCAPCSDGARRRGPV